MWASGLGSLLCHYCSIVVLYCTLLILPEISGVSTEQCRMRRRCKRAQSDGKGVILRGQQPGSGVGPVVGVRWGKTPGSQAARLPVSGAQNAIARKAQLLLAQARLLLVVVVLISQKINLDMRKDALQNGARIDKDGILLSGNAAVFPCLSI